MENNKDIERAIYFATTKHLNQIRRDGILPYVMHEFEVSKFLYDLGIRNTSLLIAGILHDTIEDTNTEECEIRNAFGEETLKYVLEVSKIGVDDSTIEDKVKFMRSFEEKDKSAGGYILKIANRWCNIQDFKRTDNRKWFYAYYALQAYPLITWFYKNMDRITNEYSYSVTRNVEYYVEEISNIIEKHYGLDVIKYIYNQGKYVSDHDKLMEILKLREGGQINKHVAFISNDDTIPK